jgi:hypothetical protein
MLGWCYTVSVENKYETIPSELQTKAQNVFLNYQYSCLFNFVNRYYPKNLPLSYYHFILILILNSTWRSGLSFATLSCMLLATSLNKLYINQISLHLHLGLPSGRLWSCFDIKILYAFLAYAMNPTCPQLYVSSVFRCDTIYLPTLFASAKL